MEKHKKAKAGMNTTEKKEECGNAVKRVTGGRTSDDFRLKDFHWNFLYRISKPWRAEPKSRVCISSHLRLSWKTEFLTNWEKLPDGNPQMENSLTGG